MLYSVLLGYGAKSNAYYIRCTDCLESFKERGRFWQDWQDEFEETQVKLLSMDG
jgi:SWI/SNF-related matrix-associated actin-dependent regulator of chromatin subfamily A member 5